MQNQPLGGHGKLIIRLIIICTLSSVQHTTMAALPLAWSVDITQHIFMAHLHSRLQSLILYKSCYGESHETILAFCCCAPMYLDD